MNNIARNFWNSSEKLFQSEGLIPPQEFRKHNYSFTEANSINTYNQYIALLYEKNKTVDPISLKMAQLLKDEVDFQLSQSIYYRCMAKAKSTTAHLLAR